MAQTRRPPINWQKDHDRRTVVQQYIYQQMTEGHGLRKILRGDCPAPPDALPEPITVYRWLASDPDFAAAYEAARTQQADALIDKIDDLIEECRLAETPGQIKAAEHAINAAKWRAERQAPQRWGIRQQIQMSGNLDFRRIPTEQLQAELSQLLPDIMPLLPTSGGGGSNG